MNINPETYYFIRSHIDDEIQELILKKREQNLIDYPFAIQQIKVRQKSRIKLPSWSMNFDLIFPTSLSLEQSSSEQTANYKSRLFNGNIFIDLTAGFGVDGITLSKNFQSSYLIDKQSDLSRILQHNIEKLGLKNITVLNQDTTEFLKEFNPTDSKEVTFYMDPSRRGQWGQKVIDLSDCEPNVLDIKELLFKKGSQIILKLSPMIDLKKVLVQIPETTAIHIIAVQNECKEVVVVCDLQNKSISIPIYTVNLRTHGKELFDFLLDDENQAIPDLADCVAGFLYEPNSAIMKSGGFKTIGNRFKLKKIDFHTHLYVSDQYNPEFPGRCFKIIEVFGLNKAELKKKLQKKGAYNLSTRNFPMETDLLKKKLQIKDGGDQYLFATIWNQKHILILCQKTKEDHYGRTT